MMKIETHCHSPKISPCADVTVEELVNDFVSAGYDGIVLVNHYAKSLYQLYQGEKAYVDAYIDGFEQVYKLGKEKGLKVFLGAEIRLYYNNTEYIVVGFDKEFLYKNPKTFDLTQEELFKLCQDNGLFMYQSHPFRTKVVAGDPKYMHGAESFNGHFHHQQYNSKAREFCEENGLIKMIGTDYHHKGQPLTTVTMIPDGIETEKQLAECFIKGNFSMMVNRELYIEQLIKYKKEKKGIYISNYKD